jgi:nitric oxide dioxygenase
MWVHESSKVDTSVEISVGGNCYLDEKDLERPSIFVAGGIGISPILSQYREFLYHRNQHSSSIAPPKTTFLYSASSEDELIFGSELAELSRYGCTLGYDRMIFTITNSSTKTAAAAKRDTRNNILVREMSDKEFRHIEKRRGRMLTELLKDAPIDDAVYYICGPPSMIDDAVSQLNRKGVPLNNVKYEKWW